MAAGTTLYLHFLKEIVLAHFQSLFGKSNRMYFVKMKAKCMKEEVQKFLSLTYRLAGFHSCAEKAIRLYVRAQKFSWTSRTRRDTNKRERSKSKGKEKLVSSFL